MADIKLKDREALRQSEEGTAILAAVSNETNTGETRKVTIPGMAEAQHRENPLVATWEKTTLFEPAAANQPDIISSSTDVLNTPVYNLDYKTGMSGPKHDFTEGYTFFVISAKGSSSSAEDLPSGLIIPSITLLNSNETTPFSIPMPLSVRYSNNSTSYSYGLAFANVSDTSFRIGLINTSGSRSTRNDDTPQLTKIEGLKLIYRPESI